MILLISDATEYVFQEVVWYLLMMILIGTASEKQVWPQKKEEKGGRGQFSSSSQGISYQFSPALPDSHLALSGRLFLPLLFPLSLKTNAS